jgi:hypothetical protein
MIELLGLVKHVVSRDNGWFLQQDIGRKGQGSGCGFLGYWSYKMGQISNYCISCRSVSAGTLFIFNGINIRQIIHICKYLFKHAVRMGFRLAGFSVRALINMQVLKAFHCTVTTIGYLPPSPYLCSLKLKPALKSWFFKR